MELRVLKYFLMTAREENITKAAGLLHITQPTLSRQLMQLEEELGVKLFTRSNHNIRLTEEGMLLRRRAQIGNHETACRRAAGRGGLITDFNHGNPVAVRKGAQSVRAVECNDPSGSLTDHLRYDVTGLGHRFPGDDVHGAFSPVQCDFRIGGIFRKVGVPERRQKQKHISCPCGYARRCFRRAGKKGSASASADHQMFRFQFIQHQFRNFGTDVQDLRQFSLRGKTVAGAQIALFDPVQDIFSGLIFQCFF